MDIVTTAIVAGVIAGTTKVGEQAVLDAYKKLKDLLKQKYGVKSKVVKAVKDLETNPASIARRDVVNEEILSAKANQDQELTRIAHEVLTLLKAEKSGNQVAQTLIGDDNIQIAGNENKVNVNSSK